MSSSIESFFLIIWNGACKCSRFLFACSVPIRSSSILTTNCAHLHGQALQSQSPEVTLRSRKQIRYFYFPCDPVLAHETWTEVCAGWNSGKVLLLTSFLTKVFQETQGRCPLFLPGHLCETVLAATAAAISWPWRELDERWKSWVNHYSTKPRATLPPDLLDEKTILIRFSYLQAKQSYCNN